MRVGLTLVTTPDKELDWLLPYYDITATTSAVDPKCGSAGPWSRGIQLNIQLGALHADGVSEEWLLRLENGFDLALDVAPVVSGAEHLKNYSSVSDYGHLAQAKCDEYLA